MIYVDQYPEWIIAGKPKWLGGGHLFGTDLEELHAFAKSIGMKRQWYQGSGFPHYDLVKSKRLLAIRHGAIPVESGIIPDDAIRHDPPQPGNEEVMSTHDTSSFFTTHQTRDVPRDQWGRYKLPDIATGEEMSYTRATTLAATLAEQYGLSIWKQRQVVWGLSRRPDLLTMATTIAGPEDKKALGAIVDEAHIAAGTQAKANRGSAIHRAIQAAEMGAFDQVPEELRIHVSKYFARMRENQLEIIPQYVERTVIIPEYDTAGTFDNLVRCPDGKIRVSDKKTGRQDYSDTEFAVQMALYANASAMFNYDTGRYEPMPEIAKDYAILVHIDPDTGHCELQDVNIEWGWVWTRTCAQTMQIRKTKHVITPHIPPTDNISAPMPSIPVATINHQDPSIHGMAERALSVGQPLQPIIMGWIEGDDSTHLWINNDGSRLVHNGPLSGCDCAKAQRSPLADSIIAEQPGAAQRSADALQEQDYRLGTVPGGYVDSTSSVPPELQAFWTNEEHDDDDESAELVNGVPVAQYGQPNTWPCSRGESCEFTGQDGLHTDGTVCLYGNARHAPIPALVVAEQGEEIRYDERGQMRVLRDGQWVAAATTPGEIPAPPPPPAKVQYTEHQAAQGLALPYNDAWRCRYDGVPARDHPVEVPGQFHCVAPAAYPDDDPKAAEYGSPSRLPQAAQSLTVTEQTGVVAEDVGSLTPAFADMNAQASNVDDLIAKIDGLKGGKAAVQTVARRLMAKLGIKEGTDGAIKLNQYKIKVAKAIVTLAHAHGVSIPGQKDGDPDFGVPTGPAPTNSAGGTPAAKKASAERSGEEVAREAQIKTAVESIRMQTTIEGLRERHDYYAQTSIGWTEEMQNAARTRAAELDLAAGQTPLTPLQMIEGATSQETLAMAWQQATDGGTNLGGWTEEMNALAMAKQSELAAGAAVAPSGNQ